jgi:hypothetical protein
MALPMRSSCLRGRSTLRPTWAAVLRDINSIGGNDVSQKLFKTGVAAVTVALTVAVGAQGALAVPPPATGTVTCSIMGNGGFGPALKVVGTSSTVKIHFVAKSTGCTSSALVGSAIVNITNAVVKGQGFLTDLSGSFANQCSNFVATDTIGSLNAKVKWISSPTIAKTQLAYPAGTAPIVTNNAGNVQINLVGPPPAAVTGSFSTTPGPAAITLVTNIPFICGATWGPYSNFSILSGSSIFIP